MTKRIKDVLIYLRNSSLLILIYVFSVFLSRTFIQSLVENSPTWIPLCIGVALLYFWGYRYLPVIFAIHLTLALGSGLPLLMSLLPALVLTFCCYLAIQLLKNKYKIDPAMSSLRDLLAYLVVGIMVSLIPASLGTLIYLVGGIIPSAGVITFWLSWWVVDLLSYMLFIPLVLVWYSSLSSKPIKLQKQWDWSILLLLVLITWWIFQEQLDIEFHFSSLTYLIFPFLFWIALRLHQPGVTLANLLVCLMAIVSFFTGKLAGVQSPLESLVMLEFFIIAVTLTSLTIAALFTERDEANRRLKEFNVNLEDRINQRTREFRSLNNQLKKELHSRHGVEKELRESQENLRTVIDNISDALVLIDAEGKAVDLNENVLSMFRVSRKKALNEFNLAEFSAPKKSQKELTRYFLRALGGENVMFDWEARRPTDNSTFEVEVSMKRIRLNNQQLVVVSIRDLSERKRVEAAEHEQRVLAEALQNTAAALSSTLELDEVFDRILKNVGKVVPHDAVNLMLIENGIARIIHSHGYQKLGMLNYIRTVRFDVDKTPSLRTMIESGKPTIIPDIGQSLDWATPEGIKWIQSYAGAPIRIRGQVIGFLQLDSGTPGFFKREDSERLQAFADQAAVAIENARLYGELQKLATTDPLTGLLNRHGFNPPARREFEIARRFKRKLSLIFFDIDHLKNINDKHGHPAGDKALQRIADCCRNTLREIDLIGRYGGDEFIIMIPESGLEDAIEIAGRLKNCVNASTIDQSEANAPLTISVGVAGLNANIKTLEELIDFADRGSYLAKSQGRDSIATVQPLSKQPRQKKSTTH